MPDTAGQKLRRITTLDALVHLPEDITVPVVQMCETIARVQSEVGAGGQDRAGRRGSTISTLPASQAEAVGGSVSRLALELENRLPLDHGCGLSVRTATAPARATLPECGAVLRHLVVNLLSRDPNPKGRSIKASSAGGQRQTGGRNTGWRPCWAFLRGAR